MRAPVLFVLSAALCAIAWATAPAAASAATAIDPSTASADPTEDEPLTVTVSGSSDAPLSLYVVRFTGSAACPASQYGYTTMTLDAGAATVGPGAFTRSYTFTPTSSGDHTICAYLAASYSSAPTTSRRDVVAVRQPMATIDAPTLSADPTEDAPVTVTVAGTSEVARSLYVVRFTGSAACPASQYGYTTMTLDAGAATVGPGAFARSYTFTPTVGGDHTICAYLTEGYSDAPRVVRRFVGAVREPAVAIDPVAASADPTQDEAVTLTVTGTTEAERSLYVVRFVGAAACPGSPYGYTTMTLDAGTATIAPGAFARSYTFTPTASGDHTVCAYVGEGYSDTPRAVRRTLVPVREPVATIDPIGASELPTVGEGVTVSVSGVSEAERSLFVVRFTGAVGCPASPYGYTTTAPDVGTVVIGPGAFARTYSFVPTAVGEVTTCAYVSPAYSGTPQATGRAVTAVSLPRATVAVSGAGAAYRPGEARDLRLDVTSQRATSLTYVFVPRASSDCAQAGSGATKTIAVPVGASSHVVRHEFGSSAVTTLCTSVVGAVASATSSVRMVRVPAAFSLRSPADRAVVRSGRPAFAWSDDVGAGIPTRVTVSTRSKRDATGALAVPLAFSSTACVDECAGVRRVTAGPTPPLAAGTYHWTVSWKDPETGVLGHTGTRRFTVPPKRALLAVAAVVSRTRDRDVVVRVRYHDNVDRHRVALVGYVGRRRVFTRSVVARAAAAATVRVFRAQLGGAIGDGQRLRVVATVVDARGSAQKAGSAVAPNLPKPRPPSGGGGSGGGGSGGGGGDGDLDCADIGHQVDTSDGDPHGLDADGDGVGCESYPGPPTAI